MEALERVARDAQHALKQRGERFVQIEARLPGIDLAALSSALPDEPMIFWSANGTTTLGLGAAYAIEARGEDRFARVRDEAGKLPAWAELFCGFAFSPGGGGAFGDARAILPRFLLRTSTGSTTLHVTLDRASSIDIDAQLAALTHHAGAETETLRASDDAHEADRFVALVTQAREAIVAGAFDKVVVHRQTRLPSSRSAAQTLAALLTSQPEATTYAFRVDGRTFLGATPERLVRRQQRALRADVLAGSWPRDGALHLLESTKDRAEHELTRRAIADVLRPLCSRYDEDGPRVRALPHIYHLHTAVEGVLATPRHVLDLVAALHPTPAVGGFPRKEALLFLAEHEHLERGWYAAPIGWFRPDGDGDFAVALRCALIDREHTTLYAGAGIVAASEPQRELAETTTKRRAMLSAIGVELA